MSRGTPANADRGMGLLMPLSLGTLAWDAMATSTMVMSLPISHPPPSALVQGLGPFKTSQFPDAPPLIDDVIIPNDLTISCCDSNNTSHEEAAGIHGLLKRMRT